MDPSLEDPLLDTAGAVENNAEAGGRPRLSDLEHPLVHSVYRAPGLELDEALDADLPRRFDPGSGKARLTWLGALCIAGVGMFVEAFVIITTGQVKTVWHSAYPTCFSPDEEMPCPDNIACCGLFPNTNPDTCGTVESQDLFTCASDGSYPDDMLCNPAVIGGISYSEFAGIMLGMLSFGKIADAMGPHLAGMLTAAFQIVGILVMTFFRSESLNTIFIVFLSFFFIFGIGVGGEYPLTAVNAASRGSESEDTNMSPAERRESNRLKEKERSVRRGETITLVFAMQGVGALVGSVFMLCLIYFAEQTGVECSSTNNAKGSSPHALDAVWRVFYFIGGIFVSMLLVFRSLVLKEGDGHKRILARKQRRQKQMKARHVLRFYLPRLIGTAGNWFLTDIAFYGLKLFSGPIFGSLDPSGSLGSQNGWLVLNNLFSLGGYYVSALLIDKPSVGRKRLQMFGYLVCAILFLISGAVFNMAGPGPLLFLMFVSSFMVNCGPNVTSYVMAAETYPAELRATCHGISAFCGKAGALLATILFSHLNTPQIFYICSGVSFLGLAFTIFFSVDLTHVSLAEHDAQLELFLEDRLDEYKGKLNDAKHLSLFERLTGRHGVYDRDWIYNLIAEEAKKVQNDGVNTIESTQTSE